MRKRPNNATLIRDKNGNKLCIRCKEWLPESNFNTSTSLKDGFQVYCIPCGKISKHKITFEFYSNLLKIQKDRCAICLKSVKPNKNRMRGPHIDHDHMCCKGAYGCEKCVRGILCFTCNNGLGSFNDNTEFLKRAISYLERFENRDS